MAIFVDVQNPYFSAKRAHGRNLSYAKMLRACIGPRQLVRAIAYVIEQRESVDQTGFLNSLRHCGLEIRKKEVIERLDGSSKAEWELGIAAEILRIADKVDTVIVASGNGVFVDVAPLLGAKGVRFECCGFMESMSAHLKDAVDRYWWLGRSICGKRLGSFMDLGSWNIFLDFVVSGRFRFID